MAMKFKYDKEADIPAAAKAEYKEKDGAWYLDVDGAEDTGALKRALDHEKDARKAAEKSAKTLQDAKDAAELAALKAGGDVAALTASYEAKIAKADKDSKERLTAHENRVKAAAIDAAATTLATKISTVPALMKRAIADRLYVDMVDDTPIIRVYDVAGKPSAANLDDLSKEMVAMPDFAAIMIGSKASGGGAGGAGQNGGTGSAGAGDKKFADMGDAERVALYRRDPAMFKQLAAAAATSQFNT